jgi:cysteine sulfinate desulfinase/cysteine desulfurase-like protein
VDREGLLKLADLENAVTDETAVVSPMWANNGMGVLRSPQSRLPIDAAGRPCLTAGE